MSAARWAISACSSLTNNLPLQIYCHQYHQYLGPPPQQHHTIVLLQLNHNPTIRPNHTNPDTPHRHLPRRYRVPSHIDDALTPLVSSACPTQLRLALLPRPAAQTTHLCRVRLLLASSHN